MESAIPSRGMSAAGAALNPATTLSPGLTRIREGDGSPVSHAAAAAAAVGEAVAAEVAVVEDEAALPATTTEENAQYAFDLLCRYSLYFELCIEKNP
jgi:hypothetical protein